ncbi:MAG TPA: NUDIX hydrolase [Patescibacteria group bacterium]|nr:NUDIX hydrolase [Patescibacteria group bacterium]
MTDESNPWTVLRSETKYDNAWISVVENAVLTPAGTPGIYGVVHLKTIATGVIPIDAQGNTVLVGQYRFPLGRYSWEIPEGGAAFAEGPLAGAQRELSEEAGLEAAHWQELARIDTTNCVTDESGAVYVAWGLSETAAHPDDDEQLTLRRLPYADALAMAMDGRITDAISLIGLMKLELLRGTGQLPDELAALLDSQPS